MTLLTELRVLVDEEHSMNENTEGTLFRKGRKKKTILGRKQSFSFGSLDAGQCIIINEERKKYGLSPIPEGNVAITRISHSNKESDL